VHQRLDCIGDNHCARRRQTRHSRSKICGQPVHVVLPGVQIHHSAVHPDPHADLYSEAAPRLLGQSGHRSGDLEASLHSAMDVVLMGARVTEYRQQPISLRRADVPFKTVNRSQDLFAVAAHQRVVGLGLHPGGEHRRIDQIGEQDRQSPDLAAIAANSQQILGVDVVTVDRQRPPRQCRRGRPITAVDRRDRLIQQFIHR
jgi:hypothetical protein